MATWEDGPEYAPRQRPAGFDSPDVAPLDAAPPRPQPSAGAPAVAPDFRQEPLPPLTTYAPETGPTRDPHEAFEVARSVMTEQDSMFGLDSGATTQSGGAGGAETAWGAVAHRAAAQTSGQASFAPPGGAPVVAGPGQAVPHPDAVIGPPQADPMSPITLTQGRRGPGEGPAFPPPQGAPMPAPGAPGGPPMWAPPEPVRFTAGGWLNAMKPATVALLALGGLFFIISPLCFAGAAWSAWQVRQRSEWVRNAVMVGAGMLGVAAVLGAVMSGGDLWATWDLLGKVSLVVCWLTLAAIAAAVGLSLARGEQPEQ
ncbi:hypothetical protein [Mariniluteicoccus flavus]